jgi:hypothetical protein
MVFDLSASMPGRHINPRAPGAKERVKKIIILFKVWQGNLKNILWYTYHT